MNVNHLILDYVAMCEKFGPLDFDDFIDLWLEADAIARGNGETMWADQVSLPNRPMDG